MAKSALLTNDETYTVTGTFDEDSIDISALIPENTKNNFYDFINITVETASQKLNAILILMKDDVNNSLEYKGTTPVPIPKIEKNGAITLRDIAGSKGFDWDNNEECLVILFHTDAIDNGEEDKFMQAVDTIYKLHPYTGNFNTNWKAEEKVFTKEKNFDDKINELLEEFVRLTGKPRRVGMSLIVKAR
jgi:hypothetical protein